MKPSRALSGLSASIMLPEGSHAILSFVTYASHPPSTDFADGLRSLAFRKLTPLIKIRD